MLRSDGEGGLINEDGTTGLLVFDAWTTMDFKRQFGNRKRASAGYGFNPPKWIRPEDQRRTMAYAILRAYTDNAAREFMLSKERSEVDARREYGDAALLVNTVLAALMGEDQQIVTEGAEEVELDTEKSVSDIDAGTADATAEQAAAQAALDLQDWLRDWAKDERLALKMLETERRAINLGDGVYVLGWDPELARPRLDVYDPTFYFPVIPDDGHEFPQKVHLAWEVVDDRLDRAQKVKIRRLTWELGDIRPQNAPGLLPRALGGASEILRNGDRRKAPGDGGIERQYPWNDKPSTKTCFFSDAHWTMSSGRATVTDLTGAAAEYATDAEGNVLNQLDIGLDFLPVVHMPNTVAIIDHYGRSVLATVLQILDDISNADTDLSAASATTGHPVLALQGGTVEKDSRGRSKMTYAPGEILETGEGKMDVLDTSKSLAALIDYIEFLLKRLSVNSRVAEALLGRIKPSEVPSGVALQLGFGPTEQLVKEMRLVRDEKYPLLLKFVHRIAWAAQEGGQMTDVPTEWIHSEIKMGSFLPQDKAAAVDQVTKLYAAKLISLETGVIILVEAGFPITNAMEEVRRIQHRDFEAATKLLDATDDQALVHEFLGKKFEPPTPPPPPPTGPPIVINPGAVPPPPNPGGNQPTPPPNPGNNPANFGPGVQPA